LIIGLAALIVCIGLTCGWVALGQEIVRRDAELFPWVGQPISEDSKASLCDTLMLEPKHSLCKPDSVVYAPDIVPVLQKKFPPYRTTYTQVVETLAGYPTRVEESVLPDGTVTSKGLAYQLTDFDGFCVSFYVDLKSGMIDRIGATTIEDTAAPSPCIPKQGP